SSTTSNYASERDNDVPAQVSGSFADNAGSTAQENCDVPTVLVDEGSIDSEDSTGAADGDVPAEVHERSELSKTNDVPIEVVEVDEEPSGEIPDAPFNESSEEVTRVPRRSSIQIANHLSDVSDEELDQLPRAQGNRPEIDELVDCDDFRHVHFMNGTGQASSVPPDSPPGESFIYGGQSSPFVNKRAGPSTSEEVNGMLRKLPRQAAGRDRGISRSPPAPPSTPPRDDRRIRLENLKKLNFSQAAKYKVKERIDDATRALSPPHGPSTPPFDMYESAPRRNVRSFLDEPGAEFLSVGARAERDTSIGRNRSPDVSSRRKRRHDGDNDRGDERERNRGDWSETNDRRSGRDDWRAERDDHRPHADGLDNGLEDLSNNPAELQRRCTAHIALSENQAASVSDDQLLSAVTEALYLLTNAQRLCKKREKLLNEMKAMRQGEVDMMKVIHADLPAHLQSVVRIEGDNVFINEAGLGGLQSSTANVPQFTQFPPSTVTPAVYMNTGTAPPIGMSPFIVPPGIPPIMPSKANIPGIPPPMPSGVIIQGPETSSASASVPPPAKSVSPDLDPGAESMSSSFMPSTFSHPPPPISSGPAPSAPLHVRPSSPNAAVTGLPDFSKPPPSMRPVNGTSNGSLTKTASSNALPDVAVPPNRSSAPPAMASATVPPSNAAPPLNFNVPPPNVTSGAGTARAPYMQPSSFLGPPPGTSNPALAQDFTKTITNMITSALKAPVNAGVNAFGAQPGMRTYVGPGMSLMGSVPPPSNMHDNGGSGEVEWTSNRRGYQYRGKSGYGKRQGNDRREDLQISDFLIFQRGNVMAHRDHLTRLSSSSVICL
ncbi:hypothetical protein GCK32_007673, partial [Trichostrongylus colubriformis]